MTFNHTTKQAFDAAHAFISTQGKERDHIIEFKEEWNNGTGYFDHLVKEDLGLAIGHRFVTQTPGEHPRRIVGVVTPVGNVVFFERYSNKDSEVITVNTPHCLSALVPSGQQEQGIFERAIGAVQGFNENIGQTVHKIALKAYDAHKLGETLNGKAAPAENEI